MKARTVKERVVDDLQGLLRKTDPAAIRAAAQPRVFTRLPLNDRMRGVWCSACGGRMEYDPELLINNLGKDDTVTCPNCHAELTRAPFMQKGVGHKITRDYEYVVRAEVLGDWQVLRYYYVAWEARLGKAPELGTPIEIVRRWKNVAHGGKEVIQSVGYKGNGGGWYGTGSPFNLSCKLSFKREGRTCNNGYSTIDYRIDTNRIAAGSQWHPALRRDGFKGAGTMRLLNMAAYLVADFFSTPAAVTLYKGHHWTLARYYAGDLDLLREDWPSLKVALRHRYHIEDPGLWHDYIKQLRELGEDVNSPRWICPENLRLAHDLTNNRVLRLRRAKKAEEDRKKAAAAEEKYARHIAAFRDFSLSGRGVVIAVIPSVEDVRQEGEHMHHCVFSNRYYDKQTSLLLSARDTDGHRLETIEFNLSTGKVEQSRAVCNGNSPKHKEILAMMKAASGQITETWKRSQTERPKIEIKPVAELAQAFI